MVLVAHVLVCSASNEVGSTPGWSLSRQQCEETVSARASRSVLVEDVALIWIGYIPRNGDAYLYKFRYWKINSPCLSK